MKEIQTSRGVLKYRMPDISEGHALLAHFDKIETGSDILKIMSRIMKDMGDLVEYKPLGYTSYKEVLCDKDNMAKPISEIAKEIYDDVMDMLIKKNQSLTL